MPSGLEVFSDIPVSLEVRLGCRATTLEEIASLQPGSAILLDRLAGEPLDLYAGDLLLGSAEVVVIEDRLSVRVTDLYLPASAQIEAASAA